MDDCDIWSPTAEDIANAQVTLLAEALGAPDYDALLALSVRDPAMYWRGALGFLGVAWSASPESYVDLSRGK